MNASCPEPRRHALVLGSTGWVGRRVATKLAETGWRVTTASRATHLAVVTLPDDEPSMRALFTAVAPEVIVNCAGTVGDEPAALRAANVDLVRQLALAASDLDTRIVHLGSAAEIGDPGRSSPVTETHPLRPVSAYGRSKARATEILLAGSTPVTVLRVFNVVGPKPRHDSLLGDLLRKAVVATDEIVLRNASLERDWVTLGFVVNVIARVAGGRAGPPIELINVCSGAPTTHGALTAALAVAIGHPLPIRSLQEPGVPTVVGDPSRLLAHTGLAEQASAAELASATTDLPGASPVSPSPTFGR